MNDNYKSKELYQIEKVMQQREAYRNQGFLSGALLEKPKIVIGKNGKEIANIHVVIGKNIELKAGGELLKRQTLNLNAFNSVAVNQIKKIGNYQCAIAVEYTLCNQFQNGRPIITLNVVRIKKGYESEEKLWETE